MAKLPATYAYTAVFSTDDDGWEVRFPDLDNAFTSANTLDEAILEARVVLEECLYFREEQKDEIPVPTPPDKVVRREGDIAQLVVADMAAVRREMSRRAVKKTLTIPYWMDVELKKSPDINVSALLPGGR